MIIIRASSVRLPVITDQNSTRMMIAKMLTNMGYGQ
jgi:hypothetical protein